MDAAVTDYEAVTEPACSRHDDRLFDGLRRALRSYRCIHTWDMIKIKRKLDGKN